MVDLSGTSRLRYLTACENSSATITCPSGPIVITKANYGRTDATTCSTGISSEHLLDTSCYLSTSTSIVSAACNGVRSSCTITANNNAFSPDPCKDTYKYLAIAYSCGGMK